ncbi:DnaJ domain-containing protein [uncultured Rhodoblastus sp.]|uniref:DnaJ domain-containing protein n=1 Tax=uncultured Rhodoblastus sp. TaxID=543037 RepID=UPI0025D5552B|nr:DnaJ domain-containing protein [uncultured Rhodoblastus sp.]
MPILLIGLLALVLCVYGLRMLGRASPAQVAAGMRNSGGAMALAAALLLLLRGRLGLAAGLGGLSFYFFAGEKFSWRKFADLYAERQKARQMSRVRTGLLEMTLDLVTGDIDGEVLAGPFAGLSLSAMPREDCDRLYRDCLGRDGESARLLEAYFDRRFAGWRAAGEGDADARGRTRRGGFGSGDMSEQEAYETLGLRAGASAQEIIRAHRRLMKERHPDHGGTTDDAARINQAKDRLLRRHG